MKTCRDCGKNLPIDRFSRHPNTIDGRRPECKSCGTINATTNRAKIREQWKRGELKQPVSKVCPRCKIEKPSNEFSDNFFNKNGLEPYCMECSRLHHTAMRRKNPKLYLWKSAKSRAKINRITFTIELDDLPDIPKFCPATGIKLMVIPGKTGFQDSLATIDRIYTDRGYIPGNVVIVSWLANWIKSKATPEQLVSLAKFYKGKMS